MSMMSPFRLSAAALVTGLSATAASAGSLEAPVAPAPVVVVETPSDWTGFYAGAAFQTGTYGWTDNDPQFPLEGSMSTSGGGVFAGYMYDFGKIVLGGELGYGVQSWSDAPITGEWTQFTVRARVGYDAGRILPYVTAGAAFGSNGDQQYQYDVTGLTYGVGVDVKLGENMLLGAAYLFTQYNDVEVSPQMPIYDETVDYLELRAAYRF